MCWCCLSLCLRLCLSYAWDYEGEKISVYLRVAEANFYDVFLLVILCWSLGYMPIWVPLLNKQKTHDSISEFLILMFLFWEYMKSFYKLDA